MFKSILITILIVSGILFLFSVMMMSPKGWLGIWIAGSAGGWWEYWSKKSIEWTLKKLAIITSIIFIITSLILPYSV